MIHRIVSDSRRVTPGAAFFAYPGEAADGRRHIPDALAQGASAVVWEAEGFDWDPAWGVPNVGVNMRVAGSVGPVPYDSTGWATFSYLDVTMIIDTSLSGGKLRRKFTFHRL